MPPVPLLWHSEEVVLSLLLSTSRIKKHPRRLPFTLCVFESSPAAVKMSFLQAHNFQSKFPFALTEKTPWQGIRKVHRSSGTLERRINKQDWWCIPYQKVKGPSKISCEVETQSPDPVEANRYCPVDFPDISTSLLLDLYGNSGIPLPHEVVRHLKCSQYAPKKKKLYLHTRFQRLSMGRNVCNISQTAFFI